MTMTFKLDGVDFLQEQMKRFGPEVTRRAGDQGTRKAARFLARSLRNATPRGPTGLFRRSIGFKYYRRTGWAKVGLRKPKTESKLAFYYKTLEYGRSPYRKRGRKGGAYFNYDGSSAMKPFFGRTVSRLAPAVSQKMIDETTEALFTEAVKVYQRNLLRNSRSRGKR